MIYCTLNQTGEDSYRIDFNDTQFDENPVVSLDYGNADTTMQAFIVFTDILNAQRICGMNDAYEEIAREEGVDYSRCDINSLDFDAMDKMDHDELGEYLVQHGVVFEGDGVYPDEEIEDTPRGLFNEIWGLAAEFYNESDMDEFVFDSLHHHLNNWLDGLEVEE